MSRACICGQANCDRHSRKKPVWVKIRTRQYGWEWHQRRKEVLAQERSCRACGQTNMLEVDHIIPRAEGGGEERSNLQALCHWCHRRKTEAEARRGSRRKTWPPPRPA